MSKFAEGGVGTAGTMRNLKDMSSYGAKARNNDIRDHGVKGDPHTPSADKQLKRELEPTVKGRFTNVKSDPDLHTDTTDLSDTDSGKFSSKNNQVKGEPGTPGTEQNKRVHTEPKGRY